MTYYQQRMGWSDGFLTPCVKWIVIAVGAAFVMQTLLERTPAGAWMAAGLALSGAGLCNGFVWQFVTYGFLHGSFWHVFMNMFGLAMLGPDVERALGHRHFLILYFLSGILGGLGFVLITPYAPCIGASASVFGVVAAFATLFPRRRLALIFLPFWPIEAWILVLAFAGLELAFLLLGSQPGIANAAHLAGALTGFVYARAMMRADDLAAWAGRWRTRAGRKVEVWGRSDDTPPNDETVDQILDKVSSRGLGALNKREREILEQASRSRTGR